MTICLSRNTTCRVVIGKVHGNMLRIAIFQTKQLKLITQGATKKKVKLTAEKLK